MSRRARNPQLLVLCVAAAFVLAGFWLRVQQLDAMPPGVSGDEAKKVIDSAHIVQTGTIIFYQDYGRPEPLHQFFGAITSLLFGNSIWVFRYESALLGLLTLPAVYWASRQCFADQPTELRALLGLFAVIVVATSLGHVTVSRSIYRVVPLTLFLAMFIGFVARALRRYARSDFVLSAVFLALGIHCYTSALAVPLIFIPLIAQLFARRRREWRRWLPGFAILGMVLLLLIAPVVYFLLEQPEVILTRAQRVASSSGLRLDESLEIMFTQLFIRGDGNPQYNTADAPLIDPLVAPLFGIGLLVLIVRIRRETSVLLLGLLIINALPALATNESIHGLRIYSEFSVVPLVAACGLIPLFHLLNRLALGKRLAATLVLAIVLVYAAYLVGNAAMTYIAYWEKHERQERQWYIYSRSLSLGEAFFRIDRQFLMNWVKSQQAPLLLPLEELNGRASRAHLMSRYPYVESRTGPVAFADDTFVVLPWSLERGQFLDDTVYFALLEADKISILPPFDLEYFERLMGNRVESAILKFNDSNIPIVAEYFSVGSATQPAYQAETASGNPLARFNGELDVDRWYGPSTIAANGAFEFSLDWSVFRKVSHHYGAFLQLLTKDWERIAGDERLLYRWLYPTGAWDKNDRVPVSFELAIDQPLAPGAYRLVAGAWYVNGGMMPAQSFVGESASSAATIGWIKAPQASQPSIPAGATLINATFAGSFLLSHADARIEGDGRVVVATYWTAPQERVDIDATSFLHAIGEDSALLAQSDRSPWGGQYPTSIWDGGETVLIQHHLELDKIDGVHLYTGMYTQPDYERLKAEQNGARLTDDYVYLSSLSTLLRGD